MTSTHTEQSLLELSAQELLEISQEINQKFAPNLTSSITPTDPPCNLTAPWKLGDTQSTPAFQSKHNPSIALLAEEILEISQTISKDFAPTELLADSTELALLPVDPFHVYAYWNLDKTSVPLPESPLAETKADSGETEQPLVLRVYWRDDENTDIDNAKLWFDLPVEDIAPRQKVRLPIDGAAYSAVLGKLSSDNQLTVLTQSNIVHVPYHNSDNQALFFSDEADFDMSKLSSQISLLKQKPPIFNMTLTYYDDPSLIGWKFKHQGLEKSFTLEKIPHQFRFIGSYLPEKTLSGQGKQP